MGCGRGEAGVLLPKGGKTMKSRIEMLRWCVRHLDPNPPRTCIGGWVPKECEEYERIVKMLEKLTGEVCGEALEVPKDD